MLSYKEYKQLNESLYGAFNLGLRQPNVVSGVIGATGEFEVVETPSEEGNDLEEAKKCGMAMKKGMKHDHEEKEEEDHDHKKKEKEEDHDHKKKEKDHDHEEKGLTAAQKKLPKALQDAILKKKKGSKKEWTEVMADVESLLEDVKNQSVIDAVRNAMNQVKESMTTRELSEEEKAWWNSVNSQLG
jgi:hypothetical protein